VTQCSVIHKKFSLSTAECTNRNAVKIIFKAMKFHSKHSLLRSHSLAYTMAGIIITLTMVQYFISFVKGTGN